MLHLKKSILTILLIFFIAPLFGENTEKSLLSLRTQIMNTRSLAQTPLLRRIMSYRENDKNILLSASSAGDTQLIRKLGEILPDSQVFLSQNAVRQNVFHLAKNADTALALLKTYAVLRLKENPTETDLFDRRPFRVALINAATLMGETPVMTQIKKGNYRVAFLYVAKNADLTRKMTNGETVLHLVVAQAKDNNSAALELLESLLRANPYIVFLKDNLNRTPLDLAKKLHARFAYEKIKETQDRERESISRNLRIRLANWFNS